ncbi:hypothetical protein M3M39_00120 [Fructilactobacillus hinvesii]|uniref:TcaA 4th domain-containing protein n=1 Tax=Fructilactobacillus hinvesii TaxID=2940300 RepID=A0ABY5BW35_9LACO|nr:hypothetical protein [Fructilactobacillus hinvesii]USS87934.1 hypothetical protein M3M39_00120 [Fructilactobacillus hinvesii]
MTKNANESSAQPQRSHWKRNLFFLVVVAVVAGLGFTGYRYYAKDQQVARITSGILNEQEQTFTNNVLITGQNGAVTAATMQPVVDYYQQHPHELAILKDQLEQNDEAPNGFRLVKKGNYFGIFPHYRLAIDQIRPVVQTNSPNANVQLDGHDIGQTGSGDQIQLPLMVPGFHSIKVQATVNGEKISTFKQISFFANEHQKITVPLAMLSFRVKGPAGAQIIVNNQKVGTIADDGTGAVTDVPLDQQTTTWLEMDVDGHQIVSEKKTITKKDNGKLISYNFPSAISKDDGFQLFSNLWSGIGNAANLNQGLDQQNVAGNFKDGTNNPDYQTLKAFVNQTHQSHMQFGTLHLQIEKVQPLGDDGSMVTYRVQSDVKINNQIGTFDNRYQAQVGTGDNRQLQIQTNQLVQ